MKFIWKDYTDGLRDTVETFLDEDAVRHTGLDDGYGDFHDYWIKESAENGYGFASKVIFLNDEPVGVIGFGDSETGGIVISEIVVAPHMRGRGIGSDILKEFIISEQITSAEAVIFPNNTASIKAFENAGFRHVYTSAERDALYYKYNETDSIDI